MSKPENIFLIGPMGAGKTSVAKQLARLTKYKHYDSDNELLKERGYVAYLTVDLETQVDRTRRQRGHRPLIDYPDARERLIKLNEEREPLYQAIADKRYPTEGQSPHSVAWQIYQDFLQLA